MFDPIKALLNIVEFTSLTTTSATTCYTAPNKWAYVHMVNIANPSVSAIQVTIEVYRAVDVTSYVWCLQDVAAKSCVELVMDFGLEDGDEIRATAATANEIDIAVVVSEGRGRSA
jgi:hypothetical protein